MKNILLIFAFLMSLTMTAQSVVPKTTLKTLDGKKTDLPTIAKENDLIVVSLWATWCGPCKNELDNIAEVYDEWQEETGVKLYAISTDDTRTVKRVKPLVNGKGWEYEILLDTNNDLKRALGAPTVPVTLIIKDGKIVYRHSGYQNAGEEEELYEELKKHS